MILLQMDKMGADHMWLTMDAELCLHSPEEERKHGLRILWKRHSLRESERFFWLCFVAV
jgi:hypothetical protein